MNELSKFVINLKRRPDRLEIFNKRVPFHDVTVINGFDGKYPQKETIAKEKYMMYKLKQLKPGELGVFISHMRIFQIMIDKSIPYAFIMEDDAIFCEGFSEKFSKVLDEMNRDIQIIFIGGRFTPEYKMTNYLRFSDNIVKHDIKSGKWISTDMERTAHAYIISNHLAQLFLNEFYTSFLIKDPIDQWILKICIKNSLDIYNSLPLLCHSPIIGDSDIRTSNIHLY